MGFESSTVHASCSSLFGLSYPLLIEGISTLFERFRCRTFTAMDDLVAVVNAAIRACGRSARQVSQDAVGSPEFIRDIRRGRLRQVQKFRTLCEALSLEFYVGPRRDWKSVNEGRLEVVVETTERILASTGIVLDPTEKASAYVAIYALVGDEETPTNTDRVERLLRAIAGGRQRSEPEPGKR